MSKSIVASQKVKGTDQIKYQAEITNTPENYSDLIKLAKENKTLQLEIFLAVNDTARQRTLARLGSLDRAKQPAFKAIDFVTVMTTYLKKITAASMCSKLETTLLAQGEELQIAVESGDFEQAAKVAKEQKETRALLAQWEEKRETERAAKAASRAANKDS